MLSAIESAPLKCLTNVQKNIVFHFKGMMREAGNLYYMCYYCVPFASLVLLCLTGRVQPCSLPCSFWASCINCAVLFCLQYYEMSYGLNVEMHKQVSIHSQCIGGMQPCYVSVVRILCRWRAAGVSAVLQGTSSSY
jgi:hypothetical protein